MIFLEMEILPGGRMSHIFYCLDVSQVDMVGITRASISIQSMTNYDLNTLKRYKDKLGEGISKREHWSWCRVCYMHVKFTFLSFIALNAESGFSLVDQRRINPN